MPHTQQYLIWPTRSIRTNERMGSVSRVVLDGYHVDHRVVSACFKYSPTHSGFNVKLPLTGKNSLCALYEGQTVHTISNAMPVAIRKAD